MHNLLTNAVQDNSDNILLSNFITEVHKNSLIGLHFVTIGVYKTKHIKVCSLLPALIDVIAFLRFLYRPQLWNDFVYINDPDRDFAPKNLSAKFQ